MVWIFLSLDFGSSLTALMESTTPSTSTELDPTIRINKKLKQHQVVGHLEDDDNMDVQDDRPHHPVDTDMPL